MPEKDKLAVICASGDREVALKMVFMYTLNSRKKKWWDTVRLIVWGPSAKLLTEDQELQEYVGRIKEQGVELLACKACADMYGVSDKLSALGVSVIYMGEPMTEMLKGGWATLSL